MLSCIFSGANDSCASPLMSPVDFHEHEVTLRRSLGTLRGLLLQSTDKSAPLALILPGSGPTNRDGDSPLGVRASPYKLLAKGLAARGISTLRIDKRGLFRSGGSTDPDDVTLSDYVADTHAWIRRARQLTGARCVWLVGHSEGGLVAMATAQTSRSLCGLVLIAAPGRPLSEVIREQLHSRLTDREMVDWADRALVRLEAGELIPASEVPGELESLFRPAVQRYLVSVLRFRPAEGLQVVKTPTLIVQGGKDLQVALDDARSLKAANPNARLLILPTLNHVLKDVAGDTVESNLATYSDADLPLGAGLVSNIAAFIRRSVP